MKSRTKPPIYPKTVIKITKLWPHARKHGHEIGQVWRVGYYSKKDGLDIIWLVDEKGGYSWTIEEAFLKKYFEVVRTSSEKSIYGVGKPQLGKRR